MYKFTKMYKNIWTHINKYKNLWKPNRTATCIDLKTEPNRTDQYTGKTEPNRNNQKPEHSKTEPNRNNDKPEPIKTEPNRTATVI